MSGIEDNLGTYIDIVKQEAEARSARISEDQEKERAAAAKDRDQREAARILGVEAARILQSHEVETVPIWDKVKIGETKPHTHYSKSGAFTYPDPIHALKNNRSGWKFMTRAARESQGPDDYPTSAVFYSLDENGILQTYHRTKARGYKPSFYSKPYDADGIIEPHDLRTHDLVELTRSARFSKAVASLVARLGEYQF